MPEPTREQIYDAACQYVGAGLSVIRIGKNKLPALTEWKPYQERRPTPGELQKWFSNGGVYGIAVLGGKVSGSLEIIDIEGRAANLLSQLRDELEEHAPGLWERLPIFTTPGNGFHLPYRCESIEGNRKLAVRIKRDEKGEQILDEHGKPETETLIETRGEGGYVATYPSPAFIHPTGRHYEALAGDWLELPQLSPEERDLLIALCCSFNEYAEPVFEHEPTSKNRTGTRPGDDFNSRASWPEILEPHGWRQVKQRGVVGLWRKPNATKHPYHASTNFGGNDWLYAFSTNCNLEPEKSYSKFSAYVFLNYGSLTEENFKQAAKDLGQQGYGEQRKYEAGNYKVHVGNETSSSPPVFNLTDLGNAQRLVHLFGKDIRYCYRLKKWFVWDERQWKTDEGEAIQRIAKQTIQAIYAEAATCADDSRRKDLATWGRRCEHPSRIAAMLALAQSENGIPVLTDDLDSNPMQFNVTNGTVDLRTGKLKPHARENLITKTSSIEYNPDATAPLFESWLLQMMNGDKELVEFLQRAIGYSLTGDVSEQCLFLLHGVGSNGKSTLTKLLLSLLGDYGTVTPIETLMMRRQECISTDIARLKGARFVSASETEQGKRLAESKIKQMTGDDRLVARFLFSEEFEYDPQFKLWIAANHKPVIQGTDKAIWRRIRLVPFVVTIPDEKQDKNLSSKLQGELPGILAWAVRGCLDWQSSGLPQPDAVRNATNNYQREMDTIADFLEACCTTESGAQVLSKPLYKAFESWAKDNGEGDRNGRVITNKAFSLRLLEKGFQKRSTNRGAVWIDLGLTANSDGLGDE